MFNKRSGQVLRLETGLLEREFLSSQANRYNLAAGKACNTCLFHGAGACSWHDRPIDKWDMLCGGAYREARPHPAKRTYAAEWLACFQQMQAAFPEKFEGVDLAPFEEMAAKEDHIFARCAAKYARQGFRVYPLAMGTVTPHKGSRAFYDATSDLEALAAHAAMHPADNIAVRTGREGGHSQIDIDPRNGGFETLAAHEREGRVLPFDAHYETPAGGFHALFEYCPDLPTGANRLGPGIDIVNDGAGTPVPPSVRSDGRYTWKTWPADGALPAIPDWVIEHVKADAARRETARAQNTAEIDPAKVSARDRMRYEGSAKGVLTRAVAAVSQQCKPGRSTALLTHAGFLAPYIRKGYIEESTVRAELVAARKTNGLISRNGVGAKDVHRTMTRAFATSTSKLPNLGKLGDRPYRSAA